MRTILTTILLLLNTGPAHAATYEAELEVWSSPPAPVSSDTAPIVLSRSLAATTNPDVTVTTSDPHFRCEVDDGHVYAVFEATPSAWPSSFPATVSCTYGSDTLIVHPVVSSPPTINVDLGSGNTATLAKGTDEHVAQLFKLPPGHPYVDGPVTSSITDVTCTVVTGALGTRTVNVDALASAPVDVGDCALPLSGGGTFLLNVAVVPK